MALLLVPVFLVSWNPLVAAAYATVLVAGALGVGPWVWRFDLGTVDAPPAEATAYLVRRFRMAGHIVHAKPPELTVAIGLEALVEIRVEPEDGRSRILYRASATIVGWLTVIHLPGIYRRVRAWGREAAATVMPADGRLPPLPSLDDAQAILMDALSETHRLAGEAYAAERETYQNSLALLILAAILVWFLLFLGLSSMSADADFSRRMATSAGWAFAITLSVSVPGGWLIRRLRRGRVARLREWASRLQEALHRESRPREAGDRGGSSLELLLASQAEMPHWLDAVRKASLSVDPMGWWAVFAMVYLGVDLLLWDAPAFAVFSLPVAVIVGVAGLILLASAGIYYRRWRQRRRETLARAQADWDRSYERLRGEMEQYIGRL